MLASLIRAGLLTAVIAAAPASAQDSSVPLDTGSGGEAPAISALRLAAGVREYPARVLRSLLLVAEDPLILRQLADEPELLERPEDISPPVPAEMHTAIRELSVMPAIVAVSADHPEELSALRELYAQAPEDMEKLILQLRATYDRAELGAAIAWQEALERDPAALEAYCELVTRFCKAQREAYEGFPCVQVLKREYYYACPPNEAVIFYAMEHAESSAATQVIEQWWETYAPYERDARILGGSLEPLEFEIGPDSVAAMPPERRASMWQPVAGDCVDAVDLVPVIMQPPADQPPEAYYARAVAEHARLWTPEMPFEPPVELSAEASEEPAAGWLAGEEGDDFFVDDWQYVEEPVEEVVYADDDWDYASGWAYGPTAYSRVSYRWHRAYYAPIVVYYCGYPIDWPLFYGCDPWWLVRLRICIVYVRCGHGAGGYYDWSGWCRPRHVVRVGRRHYYRCTYNQIARAFGHHRTYHRRSLSGPGLGGGRARWATTDGLSTISRTGSRRDGHGRRFSTAGVGSARRGPANALPDSVVRSLSSAPGGARQRTMSGIRPSVSRPPARPGAPKRDTFDRPSRGSARPGPVLRPSSSGRSPSNAADRVSRATPKTSRPEIVVPRRGSTAGRATSVAPRPSTSPPPKSTVSPRPSSSPRRSSTPAARPATSSKPKSAVSPRPSSSPRRSSTPAARPATSSKPKSAVSPRGSSGSRRSSGVSSGRSTDSEPKSGASSRGSTSSRPRSGVSSRRSTSPPPKSTVSPRPSSSPRRSSGPAARPATNSKPKSAVSPRPSSSTRRSSTSVARSATSSKPKSAVSARPSSSPRRSSTPAARPATSSKPKSAVSARPSSSPRRSSTPAARPATSSKPKSSVSSRRTSSSRPRSGISSGRSTSSKPKSAVSPRPSSSPRRSSGPAARPATSSKPKSTVSPRGSSGSRRSSGVSSGRSTSSKPKSSASSRRSSSPRPRSGVSSRRSTSSKPKSAASSRRR